MTPCRTEPRAFVRTLDYPDAAAHGIVCEQRTTVDGTWRYHEFTVDGEIAYSGSNPFIGEGECMKLATRRMHALAQAVAAAPAPDTSDSILVACAPVPLALQEQQAQADADAALEAEHAAYAEALAMCSRTHALAQLHLVGTSDEALQATLAIIFHRWQEAVLAADRGQVAALVVKGKQVSGAWRERCWRGAGNAVEGI